jgi:hypothetical protein
MAIIRKVVELGDPSPGLSHFRTARVGKSLIKFSKMRLYVCVAVSPLVNLAGGGQGLIGARRKSVMDKEFRKLDVLERRPILAA